MKHSVKTLLCLVLCICTLACFAACKNKATTPTGATSLPTDTDTIYYLSGVKYGEERVWNLEELEIADPEMCYIYFATDGTGVMNIDGWETYFTYADGQLWDELTPDVKVNYIVEGDALTLEQEGYKLVFTRGELPEWAQPQEEEPPAEDIAPEEFEEPVEENTEAPQTTEASQG